MVVKTLTDDLKPQLADLIETWRPDDAISLRHFPERERSFVDYVALVDGQVVGWLEGDHEANSWGNLDGCADDPQSWVCDYIIHMYTHERYRRQGIGTSLMQQFESDTHAAQNTLLMIWPEKQEMFVELVNLYNRFGFEWGIDIDCPFKKSHLMLKRIR